MGFSLSGAFNSIKNAVSGAGSTIKDKIGSLGSTIKQKVSSGAKIVKTNIKNSFSKDSLIAFGKGFAQGGLIGAIGQAAATTSMKSMEELDKSGKFNPKYAYKQYGFESNEQMERAKQLGYETFDAYKSYLNVAGLTDSDVANYLSQSQVTEVEPDNGGNGSVTFVGEETLVTTPANVKSSSSVGVSTKVASKYDADTLLLKTTVIKRG